MTNKQKEEIEFLCKVWKLNGKEINPTEEEIEEYLKVTVGGGNPLGKFLNNRIFQIKRSLDINLKMIREDYSDRYPMKLLLHDYNEELKHPYFQKLFYKLINGIHGR